MSSSPIFNTSASHSDRRLSPSRFIKDRSISRPSSGASVRSFRTHSPSFSLDDPIAVRNQVSTLKHTIRHQQAQLHKFENVLLRGVHGAHDGNADMLSPSSPPPSSYTPIDCATAKAKRRSSYEILHGIAGPESNLPLPRKDGVDENGIQEGVPMNFGASPVSTHHRRPSSPTRTLSRIPVASVGNARALADDGQNSNTRPSPSSSKLSPIDTDASGSSLQPPSPTPNRRISLTPGGTTKVLADLQTGVVNARNALENTKAQLRVSQRTVAQLTRQTEDLKDGRERLRLENEGLNNVVARKERLLQEVLERARKAEAEVVTLKAQLKSETSTSKKSLQEMRAALSESTALSQKSEREYITLRDSIKGLVESFKNDTNRLREEMRKREEKVKSEAEAVGKKYKQLMEEVTATQKARADFMKLREEDKRVEMEVEMAWLEEIKRLEADVERSSRESSVADATAQRLSEELARLRRLLQAAGKSSDSSMEDAPT